MKPGKDEATAQTTQQNRTSLDSLFIKDDESEGCSSRQGQKRLLTQPSLDAAPSSVDVEGEQEVKRQKTTGDNEYRPKVGVYHPSFREVERLITTSCNGFLRKYEEIKASGYTNAAIENVCAEIHVYCNVRKHYPKVGPIACLGSAGVGKSTTINSILGQEAVAIENDGHLRGTYVVHEYCGPVRGQIAKYHVIITFHSRKDLSDIVKLHCDNIEKYLGEKAESSQDKKDDELHDKYETALDFFSNVLCASENFVDKERARDYFDGLDESVDFDELDEMVQQVRLAACDDQHNIVREAMDDCELNKVFKVYSRPVHMIDPNCHTQMPSLWPIIDKISIHQDTDLLDAINLADAPGIGDSNHTVRASTYRCLFKASAVFVFASMKRSANNKDLECSLQNCISRGMENETYLIITAIDEKKLFKDNDLEGLEPRFADQIRKADAKVQEIGNQVIITTASKRAAGDDLARYQALDKQLEAQKHTLEIAKAHLKQLTVEINCHMARKDYEGKLQDLSRTRHQVPRLKVFFVSNPEYMKHALDFEGSEIPLLDREATGIPELIRHLYNIPARRKMQALRGIVVRKLPNLFRGIDGILEKSVLERKNEVRDTILATLSTEFTEITSRLLKRIRGNFQNHILDLIEKNEAAWVKVALQLACGWATECRPGTYAAFCRRSGYWRLPTEKSKKSWNLMLRRICEGVLPDAFDDFVDAIDDESKICGNQAIESFRTLKTVIDECEGSQGVCMTAFFEFVDSAAEDFTRGMKKRLKDLRRNMRIIRARFLVDEDLPYLSELMQPAYEECVKLVSTSPQVMEAMEATRQACGKKRVKSPLHQMRSQIVQDQITATRVGLFDEEEDKSIFSAMGELAKKDLFRFMHRWIKDLEGNAEKVKDRIIRDFDNRFQDTSPDVKEEDNAEAVAILKDAANEVKSVLGGPVMQLLQECEESESKSNK